MTRTLSILLDLLRFSAAVVVVVGHLTQKYFSAGWPDLTDAAVSAVAVFFVLSGFVISFVTEAKENNLRDYVVARISRLYSVLVPAIILSGLVLIIGVWLDPQFVSPWSGATSQVRFLHIHPIARFVVQCIASLGFLNSVHGYEMSPGVDSPIWSLSFEAAYYALFAFVMFTRGYRRYLLIALCCLIFGTPMLCLLPVWVCGVGVHRLVVSMRDKKQRPILGLICFVSAAVAVLLWPRFAAWEGFSHSLLVAQILHGPGRAFYQGVFYYWGAVTAVLILGASQLDRPLGKLLIPIEKPIRWAAGHTFALYLFHFPLLVLMYVVTHYNRNSPLAKSLVFVTVVGLCALLSKISEEKKQMWRRIIRRCLPHARPPAAAATQAWEA